MRRVLSRDDAIALGKKLLALVSDNSLGVRIEHTARSVTKVTNGNLLTTDDGEEVAIKFESVFGVGLPVTIHTNQLDDATMHQVVAKAESMLPPKSSDDAAPELDADHPLRYTYNERSFPHVALWHESTARATETARGDVIPTIVEQLRNAKLTGAATVGFGMRSRLYMYKYGLTAFADETDCEVTVTARTLDGTGAGWGGQAHRDWTKIVSPAVVEGAIAMANRAKNPVAFEPGRRTAILGPAAVAELVTNMAYAFEAGRTRTQSTGRSGTPFTIINDDPKGRHTKLGMRVFDPRLVMISDPADPLGGYPPFFEEGNYVEQIKWGFPTPAMTWINEGRLERLAEDVGNALVRELPTSDGPRSARLTTVSGTKTATIDQMIANCEFGIYVNRLSDVKLLDEVSGTMTGVTRDGCFLIKNGKIEKSVKNFRFVESPFLAFNKLEMIGTPERAAFGYERPPYKVGVWNRWPRWPTIVPPMMIRDFNFSGLSDAV
jgi:predicted Zn-dependent protease